MNSKTIIVLLEKNKKVFQSLFEDLPSEIYRWQPESGKWSLLEILCHLFDEECEDFRARVKSVLENPGKPFTPIKPQQWVHERKYMEENYSEKLEQFLEERETSVKWLKSLQNPNWQNTYQHPELGPMSAHLFLNNWLAHDYHHIRQINQNYYLYLKERVSTPLDYAGKW